MIKLPKLLIVFCIILVSACGQKGPLYLPKDKDKETETKKTTGQKKNGTQIYQDAWPW